MDELAMAYPPKGSDAVRPAIVHVRYHFLERDVPRQRDWATFRCETQARGGSLVARRLRFVAGSRVDRQIVGFGGILFREVSGGQDLDSAFAALADPTRRGILELLGRRDASISDLAARFGMTLTGIKKHVQFLERAGLLTTEKVGRVRSCTLGPRRLEQETAWIALYRQTLDTRLTRLGEFLERTKGSP